MFRSGEGLTSFNKDNSASFSGEKKNIYIYLAEFLKTYLKMGQNIRTETWR